MGTKPEKSMPKKWKYITSMAVWYCTITLGISIGMLGPSLVELSRKLDTTIPVVSKVFSVTTVAFVFGALLSGILLNYIHVQVAAIIFTVAIGIATILLPIAPSLVIFFCSAAVAGFGWAGYDTAMIFWIVQIWENNAASALQAQCFAFAIGTFVSPILTKSFLPDESQSTHSKFNASNLTVNETRIFQNGIYAQESQLYIPFLIGGLMTIFGGILIVVLYVIRKYTTTSGSIVAEPEQNSEIDNNESYWTPYNILLITLGFIFLGGYMGTELANIQFLSTFAQFLNFKLSQPEAALILSGMTGAYTVGRGVGIIIVLRVLPEYILLVNFILLILGNSILLIFANVHIEAVWAGAILIGIGTSTIFGSFYGYLEKHLKISSIASGILIFALGVGSSLYPLVIGAHIQTNPFVLTYASFFGISLGAISFSIIYIITQAKTKARKNNFKLNVNSNNLNTEFEPTIYRKARLDDY